MIGIYFRIMLPIAIYMAGMESVICAAVMLAAPQRYLSFFERRGLDISSVASWGTGWIRWAGVFNACVGEFIVSMSFPWMVSAVQEGIGIVSNLLGSIL